MKSHYRIIIKNGTGKVLLEEDVYGTINELQLAAASRAFLLQGGDTMTIEVISRNFIDK
jgi:hypothetical protein